MRKDEEESYPKKRNRQEGSENDEGFRGASVQPQRVRENRAN